MKPQLREMWPILPQLVQGRPFLTREVQCPLWLDSCISEWQWYPVGMKEREGISNQVRGFEVWEDLYWRTLLIVGNALPQYGHGCLPCALASRSRSRSSKRRESSSNSSPLEKEASASRASSSSSSSRRANSSSTSRAAKPVVVSCRSAMRASRLDASWRGWGVGSASVSERVCKLWEDTLPHGRRRKIGKERWGGGIWRTFVRLSSLSWSNCSGGGKIGLEGWDGLHRTFQHRSYTGRRALLKHQGRRFVGFTEAQFNWIWR